MTETRHPEGALPEAEPSEAGLVEAGLEVESPAEETDDQEIGKEAEDPAQLRQELAEVRVLEAQYLDGWQRARAELDNARKRFRREQEQSWAAAQADMLARMLPVVDDMERAVQTLPETLSDDPWAEGIVLIQRKLEHLLEQAGVAPVEAEGQAFDPFTHQAVTHEPSETVQEGHVIAELQKGYRMGDRILRPSMVRVSSGSARKAEPEPETSVEPESKGEEQGPRARN